MCDLERPADELGQELLECPLDEAGRLLHRRELARDVGIAKTAGDQTTVLELLPVVEAVTPVMGAVEERRSGSGSVASIWPRVGTIRPSSSPSRPLGYPSVATTTRSPSSSSSDSTRLRWQISTPASAALIASRRT